MSHYEDMEEYNPNQIEEQFIIDGDSVTKETYQSFKDLERQLAEARAKIKRQEKEIEKYLTRLQKSHEREEILQDQLKEQGDE